MSELHRLTLKVCLNIQPVEDEYVEKIDKIIRSYLSERAEWLKKKANSGKGFLGRPPAYLHPDEIDQAFELSAEKEKPQVSELPEPLKTMAGKTIKYPAMCEKMVEDLIFILVEHEKFLNQLRDYLSKKEGGR